MAEQTEKAVPAESDEQPGNRREVIAGLFVDFENVFYVITNNHKLLYDEALSMSLDLIAELKQMLRDKGYTLIVERCYADWEKLPVSAQRQFQVTGLLPRFVDSRAGKSSADIELSLDLLQQMIQRTEVTHFVLVGGDRDYLPVLRRIKEFNRHVDVCSFSFSMSGDVRDFVSNFRHARVIELDKLVNPDEYKSKAHLVQHTGGFVTYNPATANHPPPAASPTPTPAATAVTRKAGQSPTPPPSPAQRPAIKYDPDADYTWETQYLDAILRFLNEKNYTEIHLGPFFRWLQESRVLDSISTQEQRKIFNRLCEMGALRIEQRDSGMGFPWSAALVNYNHPLVQKRNPGNQPRA
ncbi:MAG: hypothetical protein GMKNLPBB_01841 [Myxococcota bacterium]|nr:hypothetical protein [Myxococcota bacterium]